MAVALEAFDGDGFRIIQVVEGPVDSRTSPSYGYYVFGALIDGTSGISWNGQTFEAELEDSSLPAYATGDDGTGDYVTRPVGFLAQIDPSGQLNWVRFIMAQANASLDDASYLTLDSSTVAYVETEDWTINALGDYFRADEGKMASRLGGISVAEDYGIALAFNLGAATRLYGKSGSQSAQFWTDVDVATSDTPTESVNFLENELALYIDDGASNSSIRSDSFIENSCNIGVVLDFDGDLIDTFYLRGEQDYYLLNEGAVTNEVPTWISDVYFDEGTGDVVFCGFSDLVGGAYQPYTRGVSDLEADINGSLDSTLPFVVNFTAYFDTVASKFNNINTTTGSYSYLLENDTAANYEEVDWRVTGFIGQFSSIGDQDTAVIANFQAYIGQFYTLLDSTDAQEICEPYYSTGLFAVYYAPYRILYSKAVDSIFIGAGASYGNLYYYEGKYGDYTEFYDYANCLYACQGLTAKPSGGVVSANATASVAGGYPTVFTLFQYSGGVKDFAEDASNTDNVVSPIAEDHHGHSFDHVSIVGQLVNPGTLSISTDEDVATGSSSTATIDVPITIWSENSFYYTGSDEDTYNVGGGVFGIYDDTPYYYDYVYESVAGGNSGDITQTPLEAQLPMLLFFRYDDSSGSVELTPEMATVVAPKLTGEHFWNTYFTGSTNWSSRTTDSDDNPLIFWPVSLSLTDDGYDEAESNSDYVPMRYDPLYIYSKDEKKYIDELDTFYSDGTTTSADEYASGEYFDFIFGVLDDITQDDSPDLSSAWVGGNRLIGDDLGQTSADTLQMIAAMNDDGQIVLIGTLAANDDDDYILISSPDSSTDDTTIINTSSSIDELFAAFFSIDSSYDITAQTGYEVFFELPAFISPDLLSVGDDSSLGIEPDPGTALLVENTDLAIELPYRLYYDIDGNLTYKSTDSDDTGAQGLDNDDKRIRYTLDSYSIVGSATTETGNDISFTLTEDTSIKVDYTAEYSTIWTVSATDADDYAEQVLDSLPDPVPNEAFFWTDKDDAITPYVTGAVSAPASTNNGIIDGARYVVTEFDRDLYSVYSGLVIDDGNNEIIFGDISNFTTGDMTFQIQFQDVEWEEGYIYILLQIDQAHANMLLYAILEDDELTIYAEVRILAGSHVNLSGTLDEFESGMLTCVYSGLGTSSIEFDVYLQEGNDSDVDQSDTDSVTSATDTYEMATSGECIFSPSDVTASSNFAVTSSDYTIIGVPATIGQIRWWDVALTEDQVVSYGQKVLTGTESDLVGFWYFEIDEGNSEEDLTGNGNTATLADFQSNPYDFFISSTPDSDSDYYLTPTSYSTSILSMPSYSQTGPVNLNVTMQKQWQLVISATEIEGTAAIIPVVLEFDEEPTDLESTLQAGTLVPSTNTDGTTGIGTYWIDEGKYVVIGCFQKTGDSTGTSLVGWSNATNVADLTSAQKSMSITDAVDDGLINYLSSGVTVAAIEDSNDEDETVDLTSDSQGKFYYFDTLEIEDQVTMTWTYNNPVFYFETTTSTTDTDAAFYIGEKLYPFSTEDDDSIRNTVTYTESDGTTSTNYIIYELMDAYGIDESYWSSVEVSIENTSNNTPTLSLIQAIKSTSTASDILGWSAEEMALVAMQPGIVQATWEIELSYTDSSDISNVISGYLTIEVEVLDPTDSDYASFYADQIVTMVLDAGNALLDPNDADDYIFYDFIYWSGSDETRSTVLNNATYGPELSAPYEGYTVLRFLTTSDGTTPRGDLNSEIWKILVVESEALSYTDNADGTVSFTLGGEAVDNVSTNIATALTAYNDLGASQDNAGIGTGRLMSTTTYGYLAPVNNAIYESVSDDAYYPGLPDGNIIPVNTIEYASNDVSGDDTLPYQVVVAWFVGGDDYFGAYIPSNPLQYTPVYPDYTECNGFITISSTLGSQSLYGDDSYQEDDSASTPKYSTLPTADFVDAYIYYQNDPDEPGYNPNEEHAILADANSNTEQNSYSDKDGDVVFALRDDLNVTTDNQSDYTNSPVLTSEPYVLVTYYDSDNGVYDMLIYAVYKDQAPTSADDSTLVDVDFDLVGYEAGTLIEPPYPLSIVIGASSVPSFYQADASAPNVPFWEDVNGDYWTIAGDSDYYGFFFYEMTGSFYFPELTDSNGTADYSNGDVISWYPSSLTEPIPSYSSGDDLKADYEVDPTDATWAPVEWTLDSEWPDNVAILKVGETMTYGGGDFYSDNSYYPTMPTINYSTETGDFEIQDENGTGSGSLSYQSTADEIESALNGMNSSNGPNNVEVTVTGSFPSWVITFNEAGAETITISSDVSDTANYSMTLTSVVTGDDVTDTDAVYYLYVSGVSESSDSAVWAMTSTLDDSDTTSAFALRATATELELALNNMNAETGPFGDGFVTVTGENPSFTVTWNDVGSRDYLLEADTSVNIYPISFVEVVESIAGDEDTAEVQTITLVAQQVTGLPDVIEWLSGQVVFDELNPDGSEYESLTEAYEQSSVRFYNPFAAITVDLEGTFSSSVTSDTEVFTTYSGTDYSDYEYFYMFSASLQNRVAYDPSENQLALVGLINGSSISSGSVSSLEADTNYIQPNVLSGDDLEELLEDVAADDTWAADSTSSGYMNDALLSLYYISRNPNAVFTTVVGEAPTAQTGDSADIDVDLYTWLVGLDDDDSDGYAEPESVLGEGAVVTTNFAYLVNALSDGSFTGAYFVIAENNDSSLVGETVDLEVVYLAPELVTGTIISIDPTDAFQQKQTLRLDQDFGANASYYESTDSSSVDLVTFDWIYQLPTTGSTSYPQPPDDITTDSEGWTILSTQTGQEITIEEDTALLLTDYWFYARYKSTDETEESSWAGAANSSTTSGEYVPQLSTGWVNRVLDAINYFENRYTDLIYTDAADPYTSIIQQAGAPYDGDVALDDDQDYIEDVGLIEFYTTLYNYAYDLASDAGVVEDVSDALLNAANRIAFLYYLLGNEAYADGIDPLVGAIKEVVDPDSSNSSSSPGDVGLQYNVLPPNTHAFDEMVIDLNTEELALLRGQALSEPTDPSNDQPSTGAYPVYNRLYWNFTGGEGQTAYTLNYATSDYDFDGFIDENDAEELYPQGHGDAWGHYLSSVEIYYDLLALDNFSWNYDAEPYEVDDSVIEVYYWNERRFAQTAVARIQCGIDILMRTFKSYYSEDSEGQWVGYTDTNDYRAWGVEGWARRTGQAAVFDWATANAMVPAAPAPDSGSFTLIYDGQETAAIEIGDGDLYSLDTLSENIETALNDLLGDGTVSVETSADTDSVLLTFAITWATADDTYVLDVDVSDLSPSSFGIVSEETAGSSDDGTASVQLLKIQQDNRIFGTVSRSTIEDIGLLATKGVYVQEYLDRINNGLNPIGLSPNTVPFSIDPSLVLDVETNDSTFNSHFEQVYDQALSAFRYAFKVYSVANIQKVNVRALEVSSEALRESIVQKDLEYKNQLKKFFGSPYSGTMGTGKLYAADYDGPDYYLFNYLDNNVVNDYVTPLPSTSLVDFVSEFPIDLSSTKGLGSSDSGSADNTLESVYGHYFTSDGSNARTIDFPSDDTDDLDDDTEIERLEAALDMSFDGNEFNLPLTASNYAYLAPDTWGQRDYYGTIQMALTEMVQAEGSLRESVQKYENLVQEIENQITLIQAKYDVYDEILDLKVNKGSTITNLKVSAANLTASAAFLNAYADAITNEIKGVGDLNEKIIGFSVDITPIADAIEYASNLLSYIPTKLAAGSTSAAADGLVADAINDEYYLDLDTYKDGYPFELQEQLAQLQVLLNNEPLARYEIFTQIEVLRSTQQKFLAERGEAYMVWTDRIYWNQKLAATIQERKSRDMAFRIQRNHALEQYMQAFELARRYAFLAAQAYDYETALDPSDDQYIGPMLDYLMETTFLGMITGYGGGTSDVGGGVPIYGQGGISEVLAWMQANFAQIKAQNGHTQANYEILSFSLREELAGIEKDADDSSDQATDDYSWLQWLTSSSSGLNGQSEFYDDLRDNSYYNLYCRPWNSDGDAVPGFVVSFSTTVTPGEDFFGYDLDGGDSAYDPSRFATRIYGVALEFESYDTTNLAATPRAYLVPVGKDFSRVPDSLSTEIRSWSVVDQKLPIAIPPTDYELESNVYAPIIDGVNGYFGEIRLHSAFSVATSTVDLDSFDTTSTYFGVDLVGRSVWNSQWVLIIPLESMHYNDYTTDPTDGTAYQYFLPNIDGTLIDGDSAATGGITDIILNLMTYSYSGN
ncbi:hypothetical protein [Cerasicoccus frondis]|uniref:hypothetical protein n=1 Tax=Cerasicoccus frondis TaxID=490090 RepID=UPI002852AD36|nr:hypothetical protein [Cerasicoccus frondis]